MMIFVKMTKTRDLRDSFSNNYDLFGNVKTRYLRDSLSYNDDFCENDKD